MKARLERPGVIYVLIEQLRVPVLFLGLPLAFAGTSRWWNAWLLAGAMQLLTAAHLLVLLRWNPALLNARGSRQEGSKKLDRLFLAGFGALGVATPAVAALDAGAVGWTGSISSIVAGLALLLTGYAGSTWAMAINRHFERTVRIQDDRDHRVIRDGPYRYVRHPGYAAAVFLFCALPPLLGSVWAALPVAALTLVLVARTAFEDRTLQHELRGYEDYARQTRYRLLPGVW